VPPSPTAQPFKRADKGATMQRRRFSSAALAAMGLGPIGDPAGALSESEAAIGIRAALERGAVVAVNLLGRSDGWR
jgi:hypothetical protein